jgi:UDP-N-acetylmuramyl pentapeptide phosphotransferase/UDP-N-acetylglucosamine-1-phosphate transferase
MSFYLLSIFITSVFLSLAFILIFKRLFYKFGVLDNPKKYRKNRAPIPYAMGIIFFIVFFIVSWFFIDYNYKLGLVWVF